MGFVNLSKSMNGSLSTEPPFQLHKLLKKAAKGRGLSPILQAVKIDLVIGTRPEAIKMAPLYAVLQEMPGIEPQLVFSGQHRELMAGMGSLFDIQSSVALDVMTKGQSLAQLSARLLEAFDAHFGHTKADLVLVQGDTSSASMGALAAYYHRIPVAHIEAGLRTDDRYAPFPEEMNRRMIAPIAELHFAPTKKAFDRLKAEGCEGVHLTGNTVVDAVKQAMENLQLQARPLGSPIGKKRILVTAHRREAIDGGLEELARALRDLVKKYEELEVLFPLHLNPAVRQPLQKILKNQSRIHLVEPLTYREMMVAMADSYLLMTDSGGLQEEAPAFRLPVLVLREKTERMEAVEAGSAILCGTSYERITKAVDGLLEHPERYRAMQGAPNPFGDGLASYRIAEIISHHFSGLLKR